MSREREQASRISQLIDDEVGITSPGAPHPSESGDLADLHTMASVLADLRIRPPAGFQEQLAARLPALAEQESARSRLLALWTSVSAFVRTRRMQLRSATLALPRGAPTTTVAIASVATIVVLRMIFGGGVVSASEILTRSDGALMSLVRPGQLLYRQWAVHSTTIAVDGTKSEGRIRTVREWMDGSDLDRLAGRWYSESDQLLVAYATVDAGDTRRPHAYFSPGVFGEPRGLLSLEPTREEFARAVDQFPAATQGELHAYLRRHSIYMPIEGERAFNRAVIESPRRGESPFARIVASFDESTMPDGTAVYRVRVVDPAWISFNWRSDGPPRVRLARAEIVRYIARDSFLSVRSDETLIFEDGRRRFTTRQLVEMRPVATADLSPDPFHLDVPGGTPVQRQSAFDQLSGVAAAFSRLPSFARALGRHIHTN